VQTPPAQNQPNKSRLSEPSNPGAQMGRHRSARDRLREIIFEADTPAGKAFDIFLLASIVLSVLAIMLESVEHLAVRWGSALRIVEWTFTVLFSIEYLLRAWVVNRPRRYILSFYGLVDLLAIAPTFVSFFLPGSQSLAVVRTLRLLRVFRVFKLARFLGEMSRLGTALHMSLYKISVFLGVAFVAVVILGSTIYFIEGSENGFHNIPLSVYWAIVTMTTVGYGDLVPQTALGKAVAATAMILGYAIIAVPTGIVTAEILETGRGRPPTSRVCPGCLSEGHEHSARFCKDCGCPMENEPSSGRSPA